MAGASCPLTSFEVRPSVEELTLPCPDLPASLSLEFQDSTGAPLAGRSVLILRDGVPIPNDLFLADVTSPELIAAGLKQGLIGSSNLAPLMTTELQVVLDSAVP